MIRSFLQWLGSACLAMLLVTTALRPADSTEVERGAALFLLPLAAVMWICVGAISGQTRPAWRFGLAFDALVWSLVAWIALAAVDVQGEGNLRQAVNEVWWWVTGALLLTAGRRILADRLLADRVLVLVVGLAAGLSVFAAHQQWISLPADRAAYEADPDGFVTRMGEDAPAGSPRRALLVSRLYEGGATATFALANSLAGYLIVGCILAAGLGVAAWRADPGRGRVPALTSAGAAGGLCLVALPWTHSNSAMLGLLVGAGATVFVGIVVPRFGIGVLPGMLLAAAACVVVAPLAISAAPTLWTYAPRTLQFRFQYWQSTMDLVGTYPWFGAGPGNFQDRYPQFRLDEASEGVADPHNWMMETMAAGGIPAVVLLLAAGAIGITLIRRQNWPEAPALRVRRALTAGGFIALVMTVFAWIAEHSLPDFDATVLAVLTVVILTVGLGAVRSDAGSGAETPPDRSQQRLPWLVGAIVAMGVHLSAAGGWTVPGLAVMWLVLVATVTAVRLPAEKVPENAWRPWAIRALLGAGLVVLWLLTAWGPVNRAADGIALGGPAFASGNLAAAERELAAAAQSDPWDPLPALRRSEVLMWSLLRSESAGAGLVVGMPAGGRPRPEAVARWQQAAAEAVARNPQSSLLRSVQASQHLTIYQRFGGDNFLAAAEKDLRLAIAWAPGDVQAVAQLAVVQQAMGNGDEAAGLWARARFLSAAGGHTERGLDFVRLMPANVLGRSVMTAGPRYVPASQLAPPLP